jgi:hypothetical protein
MYRRRCALDRLPASSWTAAFLPRCAALRGGGCRVARFSGDAWRWRGGFVPPALRLLVRRRGHRGKLDQHRRALSGARRIECGNRGLAARQGAPLIALEPGELLGKVGDDQCEFRRALRPPERGLAHVVRHRDAANQQLADCDQHRDLPPQIAGRTIARVVERAGHDGVTGAPHPHEVNLRLRDRPGEIGKLGADADAGGAIADGARDPRDLLGQQRIVRGRNVEAMAERVLLNPRLAGRTARAGAQARVGPVGGALAFSGHARKASPGAALRPRHRPRCPRPRAPGAAPARAQHDAARSRGAPRRGGLPST